MQTVRHLALQKELSRIEAIALAHTQALLNRAADLETAYDLCFAVSVGLPQHDAFTPTVTYDDDNGTCDINIFTFERGAEFLQRAVDAGLAFAEAGNTFGAIRDIAVDGFPRVHVLVVDSEMDAHRRAAWLARRVA